MKTTPRNPASTSTHPPNIITTVLPRHRAWQIYCSPSHGMPFHTTKEGSKCVSMMWFSHGPCRYRSPRHRMHFHSTNDNSKCETMTWQGIISATPYYVGNICRALPRCIHRACPSNTSTTAAAAWGRAYRMTHDEVRFIFQC